MKRYRYSDWEDLVQEIMLRMWKIRSKYNPEIPVLKWAYSVAGWELKTWMSRGRSAVFRQRNPISLEMVEHHPVYDKPLREDWIEILTPYLDQRECHIVEGILNDMSGAEISRALGITEAVYRNDIRWIRRKLKSLIRETNNPDPLTERGVLVSAAFQNAALCRKRLIDGSKRKSKVPKGCRAGSNSQRIREALTDQFQSVAELKQTLPDISGKDLSATLFRLVKTGYSEKAKPNGNFHVYRKAG